MNDQPKPATGGIPDCLDPQPPFAPDEPASGEWTYDQVDDLFSALGIMGIVQCHNAALAAAIKQAHDTALGLHDEQEKRHKQQLAAEREKVRQWEEHALKKVQQNWIRAEDNPGFHRHE